MKPPSSGDPAFLETCHRWLLFHYHCADCGQSENTCEYGKVCSYGKSTFTHVAGCTRPECSFPRCALLKSILSHHQACKDTQCQMCSPVCKYQARSRAPPPPPPPPPPSTWATTIAMSPASSSTSTQLQGLMDQPTNQSEPGQIVSIKMEVDAPSPPQQLQQQPLQVAADPPPRQQQQQQSQPQHPPQHIGFLFEARHREQARQLSGSYSCQSSGAPAETGSGAGGSGAASSNCNLTTAPSGAVDAVVEMQALQLEKFSPHQHQHLHPHPHQQQEAAPTSEQREARGQSAVQRPAVVTIQCLQAASPQQVGGSSAAVMGPSPAGAGADAVAPAQHPAEGAALRVVNANDHQRHQHHQQQLQSQHLQQQPQQSSSVTALSAMPTQTTPSQAQQEPGTGSSQQQSMGLPVGPQAMVGGVHFMAAPGLQLQPFGTAPPMSSPGLGLPGAAPGVGTVHTGGPAACLPMPYGSFVPVHPHALPPVGVSACTLVHHPASQGTTLLLSHLPHPHQHQQGQQHMIQSLALAQQQQHALGPATGVPTPMQQAGPGLFVGSQSLTGLAATGMACGPAAMVTDSSGGGIRPPLTAVSPWGPFPVQGAQVQALPAVHQHPQHMQGHFSAVPYGSTGTSVFLTQQLTGTT